MSHNMTDSLYRPSFPTLHDFNLDGHAALEAMIATSSFQTVSQTVASLTIFSHPDTVRQTNYKPVIRTIRNASRRGEIVELNGARVGLDDNKSPTDVFMWCNGLRGRPRDIQFNHVYGRSSDPDCYTCLANLCITPSFLAKLTDTNPEIRAILQYRVWDLYRWHPVDTAQPPEPQHYTSLKWAPTLQPIQNVRATFEAMIERRAKDRSSILYRDLGLFNQWTD